MRVERAGKMRQRLVEAMGKGEDIQAAALPVIQQEIGQAGAGEVSLKFLVVSAGWEAERNAAGRSCRLVSVQLLIGLRHLRNLGYGARINAGQVREAVRIDGTGKVNETHVPVLEARLVNVGDIIACAGVHRGGVSIVLIGDIEGGLVLADPGDKSDMARRAEGPYAIGNRKDGDGGEARLCPDWQSKALGIYNPLGGVSPVERQIIAQQVPLLPGPPDTIAATWIGAGTEPKGIAIRGKGELLAVHINRRVGMVKSLRVPRDAKFDADHGAEQKDGNTMRQVAPV